MPRPHKPRRVDAMPRVTYFKPSGIPMAMLEEVLLTVDELEALRLKDVEGLEQNDCAERMGIAQSTLQRILVSARKKISSALVEGKALRIEGGAYAIGEEMACQRCRHRWKRGQNPNNSCPACES